MRLDSPVTTIRGVGTVLAEKLEALGVKTIEDLVYFFPRRYENFSQIIPITQIAPGKVSLRARVESVTGRYIRRGLHITEAVLADGTAKTLAVWFNQPYRSEQLKNRGEFYFSGTYELQRNRYVLSNPATEAETDLAMSTGRIVPIYSETKGLKSVQIRRIIRELWPLIAVLPETMPSALLRREQLLDINHALRQLHFPESTLLLDQAKNRLAFEELLAVLLASLLGKQENARYPGHTIPFRKEHAQAFVGSLPFSLTAAQKRSAWEILQELDRGLPMKRLLQGDVGSGKTVVAALAAFMVVRAGYQVALMAPTEILAAQHAGTFAKLLEPLDVRLALLAGSLKPAARQVLRQKIATGETDVVIGTHAIIQPDNQFNSLGLVIIDEQHRFGVDQRAELLKKSCHIPHLLSMTATPIPRSLQLTVYGELDISIIDELPAGRKPVITRLVSPMQRRQLLAAIDQQIDQGRQVYVVCPLILEGEGSELQSVEAEHAELESSVFGRRRLGMLHGQMKAEEKDEVMRQFKAGQLDVLITTSVIEVGVDVPNASVMLVEGAERFGLAQLHQLRGRVGRAEHQGYCYLLPSSGKKPSQRLLELEHSNDGFYLAEVDLKLRGPGEIYGRMQHGQISLKLADLADTTLVRHVRDSARWLLDSDIDLLQYKQLYQRIKRYRGLTTLN